MAFPPAPGCPCGCSDVAGIDVHRFMAALADDDIDAALGAGLLDLPACANCRPHCRNALLVARDSRVEALAARERFRAREARLARRRRERVLQREAAASASATALPPAAAAALARARAKAARPTHE